MDVALFLFSWLFIVVRLTAIIMDDVNPCRRLTTLNKSVHMKLDINSKKPLVSCTGFSVTNKIIYYLTSTIGV